MQKNVRHTPVPQTARMMRIASTFPRRWDGVGRRPLQNIGAMAPISMLVPPGQRIFTHMEPRNLVTRTQRNVATYARKRSARGTPSAIRRAREPAERADTQESWVNREFVFAGGRPPTRSARRLQTVRLAPGKSNACGTHSIQSRKPWWTVPPC